MAYEERTADDVQQEITRTRAELADTLGVLGRRLSPAELRRRAVDQTIDHVKDAVVQLPRTVQRHPVPLAVVAAVTLAVLARRRQARRADQRDELGRMLRARLAAALAQHGDGTHVAAAAGRAATLARDIGEHASQALGDAADHARHMLTDRAKPAAERVLASIEGSSRERPLLALSAAMMAGALCMALWRR